MGATCGFCIPEHIASRTHRFFRKTPECANHELALVELDDPEFRDQDVYKCHICNGTIKSSEGRYHCRSCGQDECPACLKSSGATEVPDKQSAKLESATAAAETSGKTEKK